MDDSDREYTVELVAERNRLKVELAIARRAFRLALRTLNGVARGVRTLPAVIENLEEIEANLIASSEEVA